MNPPDDFLASYELEEAAEEEAAQKRQAGKERCRVRAEAREQELEEEREQKLDMLVEALGIKRQVADEIIIPRRGGRAFQITEDGLASMFAHEFDEALRYSHDRGRWFQWDGHRWHEETTEMAFHFIRVMCRTVNVERRRMLAKASTFAAIERIARADRKFAMRGDEWDTDPWLLNTPGGTVDLHTGEMRPPKQSDLITRCTLVAPELGEPVLWLHFLEQITQGDRELQLFLRNIFGYCLTGLTTEECLFYVYGPGGNGKGTLMGAQQDIMGDYAVTATMDTFLASRFERHSTDLAMLRNARMVSASETTQGRAWDEQRIKSLTGGDPITARFMRQDNFTYKPIFKLMLFGNSKPVLKTVDDACRRRFHIVPFNYKPPKADNTLKARLRVEYARILHWGIEGCLDWQRNGLVVPASVKAETESYFMTQDLIGAWIEVACEVGDSHCDSNSQLFDSWKRFCEEHGEQPGVARTLADRLAERGFRRIKDELRIRGRGFAGLRTKLSATDAYRRASDGE